MTLIVLVILLIIVVISELGTEYSTENSLNVNVFLMYKWISLLSQTALLIGIYTCKYLMDGVLNFFCFVTIFLLTIQYAILIGLTVNSDVFSGPDRHVGELLHAFTAFTVFYAIITSLTLISLVFKYRDFSEKEKNIKYD